ncbi:MAG TPA: hypothetical protein VG937_03720 [Polyangiaceae bacterium]|jgi:hypothetical protein|nr:hypothetical protein [Polyangiaceae bacterium]
MKTCEYAGEPLSEPRSHPWTDAALASDARYYDFTRSPALIRSSLEDFAPFRSYPAIEDFYALLERINHPQSWLESNDCAFNGPGPNQSAQVPSAVECSGRLMLLYRALELNRLKAHVAWLRRALHEELAQLDPRFVTGVVGTTLIPVRYLALPLEAQLGEQLMVSFWSFGDSEASAMQSLARIFKNLSRALRSVSSRRVELTAR